MKKLHRYPKEGYLGGVCHGLGVYTSLDPIIYRVIAFLNPFLLIYIVLWVCLPTKK